MIYPMGDMPISEMRQHNMWIWVLSFASAAPKEILRFQFVNNMPALNTIKSPVDHRYLSGFEVDNRNLIDLVRKKKIKKRKRDVVQHHELEDVSVSDVRLLSPGDSD